MNLKDSIISLVSKGNLEEALALWLQSPSVSDTLRTDLLGYSARLANTAGAHNQGRIDFLSCAGLTTPHLCRALLRGAGS